MIYWLSFLYAVILCWKKARYASWFFKNSAFSKCIINFQRFLYLSLFVMTFSNHHFLNSYNKSLCQRSWINRFKLIFTCLATILPENPFYRIFSMTFSIRETACTLPCQDYVRVARPASSWQRQGWIAPALLLVWTQVWGFSLFSPLSSCWFFKLLKLCLHFFA